MAPARSHEPVYHYDDPNCKKAIGEIKRRNMLVVLEEEFENTIRFINKLAVGVQVIIPRLGLLNSGYSAFVEHGVWDKPKVYADTALASRYEIKDYLKIMGMIGYCLDRIFHLVIPKRSSQKS